MEFLCSRTVSWCRPLHDAGFPTGMLVFVPCSKTGWNSEAATFLRTLEHLFCLWLPCSVCTFTAVGLPALLLGATPSLTSDTQACRSDHPSALPVSSWLCSPEAPGICIPSRALLQATSLFLIKSHLVYLGRRKTTTHCQNKGGREAD